MGQSEKSSLTVSPVEFGEGGRVAAGQLGGAPEGPRRQVGQQRAVTLLCEQSQSRKSLSPVPTAACLHSETSVSGVSRGQSYASPTQTGRLERKGLNLKKTGNCINI